MPQLVESPVRVPVPGGKLIDEYVGRASTGSEAVSVAHMRSPAGWEELAQTPGVPAFRAIVERTAAHEFDLPSGVCPPEEVWDDEPAIWWYRI